MGKKQDKSKIAGLIKDILKGDVINYESLKTLPVEQIIEQFNIYHQELEYQNRELSEARNAAEFSETRFRKLFEEAPFGYVILDEDMHITRYNRAFCELTGLRDENLIGRRLSEFIESRYQDDFYLYLRRVKETKTEADLNIELGFTTAEKNCIVRVGAEFFSFSERTPSEEERQGEFRLSVLDITGQKKQEERIQMLLETLPVGVVAADEHTGEIVFCNQTMLGLTGSERAALIGRSLSELHPESARPRAVAEYAKGSKIDVNLDRPLPLSTKGGKLTYVTIKAVKIELNGKSYWCGVFQEVTDQIDTRDKKQMFRDIVDNTSDMIGTATVSGEVIYVNDTFHTRLGYDIEKEVLGRHLTEFHPEWVKKIMRDEALPTLMEHGRWEGEMAICSKDGTEVPVSQLMIRHDKPDGSIDYISTTMRNISERREIQQLQDKQQQMELEAAQKLEKERRKMEIILAQAPDAVVSVGEDLTVHFVNGVAEKMFRVSAAEATGKPVSNFFPQLSSYLADNKMNIQEKVQGHDIALHDLEGNMFWGQVSVSVVDFEDDLHYTFFIRDVTESKQNEELLIQNTRRLNEIALYSRTIAWEIDPQGIYTFVSPVFELMLGYKAGEVIGKKTVFDFHPELGRDTFKAEVLRAMGKKSRFAGFYNKMQAKDGRVIWVSTNGMPVFDSRGNLTGYRGSDTDITDLMEAEQRNRLLQKAVESSTVGIVLADMQQDDRPLIYVNPAFEQISGYKPDEVVGRNCRFLQGEDRLQPDLDIVRKAIREGSSCRVTLRNYRKNGKLFWNQLALSPIFDDQNNLTHFVGIQQDVTRLKEAETSLVRQTALQSFLLSVSARFVNVSPQDLQTVMTGVLDESADMLHAERLCLVSYSESGTRTSETCRGGKIAALGRRRKTQLKSNGTDCPAWLFGQHQNGETVYIHDAEQLPESHPLKKWLSERGIRGFTAIPLIIDQECTGFLAVETISSPLVLEREHRGMLSILIQLLVNLRYRLHALEKVVQSEEKFSMAFQSSPYAIVITDPETGRFIEVNDSFEQYTGYTPDDVKGNRINSLNVWVSKEDRSIMKSALERGEAVNNMEFQFRKKNGELFTGLISARVIQIDGKPFFITSINDVTDKKAAEARLADSEEKYRLLFNANKDAISIYSLEAETPEILEINSAAEDLTGYSREELRRMNAFDLEPDLTTEALKQRNEKLHDNAVVNYETRIKTKAGIFKDIEVKAALVFYDDKLSYMSIDRDITQRKENDKRLKEALQRNSAMLSALPDMMFMFNRKQEIIDYSAGNKTSMYALPDSFIGKKLSDILPENVAVQGAQAIKQVLETGEAGRFTYHLEINGARRYYEARTVRCGTAQVMAVVRDVTETREAAQEILRYSRIFEGSINEIYLFRPGSYRFEVMNPAALQNLGYEAAEVSGLTVMQVANVTTEQLDEMLAPLLQGEKSVISTEAVYTRKDGTTYEVESFTQLITFEDEQLFAGIVVDISERLKYLHYVENQNKVLREISWTQSHLVRAPLARMMSLIGLLRESDFETFSEEEILGYLTDSAAEIDAMIHEIAEKTEKNVFTNPGLSSGV
ncbi:MAG: PAS domain S-box protein [Candidatus Cyclonatronum sp.]|uniref:PAS domain S-box protein n=1 Tax=Cyclonatronum sp. TaxID=3024185 RepID=UPI0025B913C6|nr:PAS domain S-box protein [Cyclonatronum sp.]MCH8487292.1 PAS domain S-box protein [Cyclonatronum sp.]